ncbi:proline-rich protein 18 [Cricetulus griseus]|nr:proline-rich protein 18 [Cricetulus griseus]
MIRLLGGVMSFKPMPPPPPPPPARTQGGPAARQLFRRSCAPPAPSPPVAAGEKKRTPEMLLSSSWPSATLKRPPSRRGPGLGPGTPQPPTSARVQSQPSQSRVGTSTTCSAPRRVACSHSPAGATAAGTSAGAGPDDATRFSLSLTPEAILVIQRRHLEKQLLARPRRPFSTPSADSRRPLVPCPRTRTSTARRGGPTDPPLAVAVSSRSPSASLMPPGGLQATLPSLRPSSLRPVLKVSLLNEKHKYDDEEYEEEVEVVDEGLVRKCTEWLRGVESAHASRGRMGHLDTLPHLSTLLLERDGRFADVCMEHRARGLMDYLVPSRHEQAGAPPREMGDPLIPGQQLQVSPALRFLKYQSPESPQRSSQAKTGRHQVTLCGIKKACTGVNPIGVYYAQKQSECRQKEIRSKLSEQVKGKLAPVGMTTDPRPTAPLTLDHVIQTHPVVEAKTAHRQYWVNYVDEE